MLKLNQVWPLIRDSFSDFLNDHAMAWAAAIAFYTALSFAPIILLLISIGEWLGPDTQDQMVGQVRDVMGTQAAGVVDTVVENAERQQGQGWLPFLLGLAVTLFSASGVFGQLQVALNQIWEVRAKPGGGVMAWIRKRLLSMGMVATLAFMLLVSLAASAMVGYVLPQWEALGRAGSIVVSLLVLTPLFVVMFKFLPDVVVAWRDVIFGAVLTAVLFVIGREGIGLYLSKAAPGSAYGTAGSMVVLLVWVYYSAIIVLLGAEITQTRARLAGRPLEPDDHAVVDDAVRVKRKTVEASESARPAGA
jgi:membrane protein